MSHHFNPVIFDPSRLKFARLLAGLTRRQLAGEVSGQSSASIQHIETSQTKPDPRLLLQLAMVLKVHPSFFEERPLSIKKRFGIPEYTPRVPEPTEVFFLHRGQKEPSRRHKVQKIAQVQLGIEVADLLERLSCPIPQVFGEQWRIQTLEDAVDMGWSRCSYRNDRELCEDILSLFFGEKRYILGKRIVPFLESCGILFLPLWKPEVYEDVWGKENPASEITSLSHFGNPSFIAVDESKLKGKLAFEVACQWGHIILHQDFLETDNGFQRHHCQQRAEFFARCALLPDALIRKHFRSKPRMDKKGWQAIADLSSESLVPIRQVLLALNERMIISDGPCKNALAKVHEFEWTEKKSLQNLERQYPPQLPSLQWEALRKFGIEPGALAENIGLRAANYPELFSCNEKSGTLESHDNLVCLSTYQPEEEP